MTPPAFTIEVSDKPENGGYRTVVGRDAENIATGSAATSALYLQVRPDNSVGIEFTDAAGNTHDAFSPAGLVQGFDFGTDPDGVNGHWYNLAATSDGSTLKIQERALVEHSSSFTRCRRSVRLAIGTTSGSDWHAGEFSVGRGLFNGGHSDRAYGYIDEVRISNSALDPSQFLTPVLSKLFTWVNAGSGAFELSTNWDQGLGSRSDTAFHRARINNVRGIGRAGPGRGLVPTSVICGWAQGVRV